MPTKQDYQKIKSGDTFQRVTVDKLLTPSMYSTTGNLLHAKQWVYLCTCQCGEHCKKSGRTLLRKHPTSCGKCRGSYKQNNIIEMSNYMVVLFDNDPRCIKFDKEDFYKIKDYYWVISRSGYATSQSLMGARGQKTCSWMHRLVTNCPRKLEVDHKYGVTLDNRKENLVVCTHQENMQHRVRLTKDNSTGYTGVYRAKKKWCARIDVNNVTHNLGTFPTIEEATDARKIAEKRLLNEKEYSNWEEIFKHQQRYNKEVYYRLRQIKDTEWQKEFALREQEKGILSAEEDAFLDYGQCCNY
jgi:hypothetical protein